MADERVKIIDIQVRYQDAVEGLAKFRSSLAEARKYQADLKKELKAGTITQEQYESSMAASNMYIKQQGDQMRELSKQVNNQIKATREQEGSLKQLRAELSNATQKWDAMSRAERESAKGHELKDHINQITSELKGAEEETQRFYRNVGNYKSATEGLETIKAKIQGIGNSLLMMIGGGSFLAFGRDVLQVTRDFEDAMARVKAVTNASAEDLQIMTDKARELGRTTIYHATDAANALETLSRGGLSAAEATEAVSMTLKMAQANTIGLNESADIMIRTMRGFKLPFSEEEMTKASDILSKTAASSATNISEIAEAMKNAAPFAASLNIPLDEISASLGVLADRGVRASDAGTAMRMVLLGLAEPTSKAGKVFRQYGIEISQAELQTKGLAYVLETLNKSGIMESEHSMNELSAIFGRRAVSSVTSLIGSLDEYQDKLEEIKNSNGTTARMFEDSYSDVSKSIFTLSSAWESFKISLGESNNGMLIKPLEALTKTVLFLGENIGEVTRLVVSAIAAISFVRLTKDAQASFLAIRESAITNAETATSTVRNLEHQQIALRKSVAAETTAIEQASGTERLMIESKLLANKRQLVATEKALVKAKTAEVQAWETAAAVNSSNTWKSSMAVAKVAVQGFVTAAKAAFKGFVVTAAITLAIDGLMTLVSWLKKNADAAKGLTREMELLGQADKKAAESCADQISKLKQLYDASQNVNLSEEERRKKAKELIGVAKEMNDEYPNTLGNLDSEAVLAGKAAGAYNDLADAILRSAKARAYEEEITKLISENIQYQKIVDDNKAWMDDNQARYDKAQESLKQNLEYTKQVTGGMTAAFQESAIAMRGAAQTKDKIIDQYITHQQKVADNLELIGKNEDTISYFEKKINEMNKPKVGSTTGDNEGGAASTYVQDLTAAKESMEFMQKEYKRILADHKSTTKEIADAYRDFQEAKKDYDSWFYRI